MKKIEMHCHSTLSDGKNTPEAVIQEAQKQELEFLALTDHDRIAPQGVQKSIREVGITTCDSVEISARNYDLEKSLHLVSYARVFRDSLQEVLDRARSERNSMKWGQFDLLIDTYGFEGTRDEFDSFLRTQGRHPDASNKYDMALYFAQNQENIRKIESILGGKIDSRSLETAFYEECLKREGSLYGTYGHEVAEYEPGVDTVIQEVIQKSSGVVSLAHPNVTFSPAKGGIEKFRETIGKYIEAGVNAIEINTQANKDWIEAILQAQKQHEVLLTFGSDCHTIGYDGNDGKHASIGQINPFIDAEVVDRNFDEFLERIQ